MIVDHLFNTLLQPHPNAVVQQHPVLVDVPLLVTRISEAVAATRQRLQCKVAVCRPLAPVPSPRGIDVRTGAGSPRHPTTATRVIWRTS